MNTNKPYLYLFPVYNSDEMKWGTDYYYSRDLKMTDEHSMVYPFTGRMKYTWAKVEYRVSSSRDWDFDISYVFHEMNNEYILPISNPSIANVIRSAVTQWEAVVNRAYHDLVVLIKDDEVARMSLSFYQSEMKENRELFHALMHYMDYCNANAHLQPDADWCELDTLFHENTVKVPSNFEELDSGCRHFIMANQVLLWLIELGAIIDNAQEHTYGKYFLDQRENLEFLDMYQKYEFRAHEVWTRVHNAGGWRITKQSRATELNTELCRFPNLVLEWANKNLGFPCQDNRLALASSIMKSATYLILSLLEVIEFTERKHMTNGDYFPVIVHVTADDLMEMGE